MKFNTKLLQIFVNFYGLLGNQLHPFERKNSSSSGYFYLTFNLTQNCLFLYYFQNDLFLFQTMMTTFEVNAKPLFSLIVRIFLMHGQQVLLSLSFLSSFWYGPQMTCLLNSPSFNSVPLFNDRRFIRHLVLVFITFDLLLFALSYSIQIGYYFTKGSLYSAGALLVILIFSTDLYLHLHMLSYGQYGSLVVLRQLTQNDTLGLHSSSTVVHKVRALALTNDRLFSIISLSFSTFLLLNVICVISTVGMYTIMPINSLSDLVFALYPILTWVYIVFLVHLNGKVLSAFDRFYAKLLKAEDQTWVKSTTGELFFLKTISLKANNTNWSGVNVHELREYRALFQLRLFSIVKMNYSFLLAVSLFVLNLIVFLIQTK